MDQFIFVAKRFYVQCDHHAGFQHLIVIGCQIRPFIFGCSDTIAQSFFIKQLDVPVFRLRPDSLAKIRDPDTGFQHGFRK